MTEPPVTRGEFEMLRQQVAAGANRLDILDTTGTRGVGVLQLQVTDLTKDVQDLKNSFDLHEKEHAKEARDRVALRRSAWRWGITTFIAFLAMVEGPLLYLVVQHARK